MPKIITFTCPDPNDCIFSVIQEAITQTPGLVKKGLQIITEMRATASDGGSGKETMVDYFSDIVADGGMAQKEVDDMMALLTKVRTYQRNKRNLQP